MNAFLFILGAGFSVDAINVVPPAHYSVDVGYPLTPNLWALCFPNEDPGESIELRFQRALDESNGRPIEALIDRLLMTDHSLTPLLRSQPNCYQSFLRHFSESDFLTFNYDSLVEILLLDLGRWSPVEGFGVRVNVDRGWKVKDFPAPSRQLVIHLHGVPTVFAEEAKVSRSVGDSVATIELRDHTVFHFDPGAITDCFTPFDRVLPKIGGYQLPHERVIAPVPDKADNLTREFIDLSYGSAIERARRSTLVVAVGYSFNSHDRTSFGRLLKELTGELVVITPEARNLCDRLRTEYPVRCKAVAKTFRQWADSGFVL